MAPNSRDRLDEMLREFIELTRNPKLADNDLNGNSWLYRHVQAAIKKLKEVIVAKMSKEEKMMQVEPELQEYLSVIRRAVSEFKANEVRFAEMLQTMKQLDDAETKFCDATNAAGVYNDFITIDPCDPKDSLENFMDEMKGMIQTLDERHYNLKED